MAHTTKIHKAYGVGGLSRHEATVARFWDGEASTTAKLCELTTAIVSRAFKNPKVVKAIRAREKYEDHSRTPIAMRKRRQQFWTEVMFDESLPMATRLKASELLGKSEADFTDKHQIDGNLSLSTALNELDEDEEKLKRERELDSILN